VDQHYRMISEDKIECTYMILVVASKKISFWSQERI